MEKQQLDAYLLSKQLRIEAFKELSRRYPLTEEMMLAFQNELDWTKVSANNSIPWCAGKSSGGKTVLTGSSSHAMWTREF